ncbi:MAG: coenzyme F420-0:L-glutamate ligase [Spirochaetaceae bacterium]|nr:coenzyme F420-0:L-glutamate ligase [Spirochaetaceae bacterium]
MKTFGVISRGLIGPIINKGDDIALIAADTLCNAVKEHNITLNERDILGITESVVARSQGNYANLEHIAVDVNSKMTDTTIGLVFPILSRNRFAPCLEGIAKTGKKIILVLSYPSDEVGNHLIAESAIYENSIDKTQKTFTVEEFHKTFGTTLHQFTGVDYLAYYASIMHTYNPESQIILSNNPTVVLDYTKSVIACDIHTRLQTKHILQKHGAHIVLGLDDILTKSVQGSGFNSKYGLLGSNKASDDSLKLFPENPQHIVERVQELVYQRTKVKIEVLVYGDGAFKDPQGKIWELADPVVSPAYTSGLKGTPNEVKLKYIADNLFADLPKEEQTKKIAAYIENHQKTNASNIDTIITEGTTPRQLTDLIGSLCDLTSGSGDKGTPFIFIQGYFDKFKI